MHRVAITKWARDPCSAGSLCQEKTDFQNEGKAGRLRKVKFPNAIIIQEGVRILCYFLNCFHRRLLE